MSEPISLGVLIHSATLYTRTGEDNYGNPSYSGSAISLTRVRVSRAKQTIVSSLGEGKNDKLVLTFDCVNSLPVGTTFGERDKIVYGGQDYIVREVSDPSGDVTAAHHYRLALVGS